MVLFQSASNVLRLEIRAQSVEQALYGGIRHRAPRNRRGPIKRSLGRRRKRRTQGVSKGPPLHGIPPAGRTGRTDAETPRVHAVRFREAPSRDGKTPPVSCE